MGECGYDYCSQKLETLFSFSGSERISWIRSTARTLSSSARTVSATGASMRPAGMSCCIRWQWNRWDIQQFFYLLMRNQAAIALLCVLFRIPRKLIMPVFLSDFLTWHGTSCIINAVFQAFCPKGAALLWTSGRSGGMTALHSRSRCRKRRGFPCLRRKAAVG